MIDGLKIELKSDELKTTIQSRADHHKAKVKFYEEQVVALQEQGVSQAHITNDPITGLKNSAQEHRKQYAFFSFVADHIIPNEIYRIDEYGLTRLELTAKYLL